MALPFLTYCLFHATFFTMTSGKIPPHVARELKRHVAHTTPKTSTNSNSKMAFAVLGCATVVSLAAAMPYFATSWIGNLNSRDSALTAAQTRRGAFNNSGTRDVGKDPQWDFKTGTYKRDAELDRMIRQENAHQVEHDDELVKKQQSRRQ